MKKTVLYLKFNRMKGGGLKEIPPPNGKQIVSVFFFIFFCVFVPCLFIAEEDALIDYP